MRLDRGFCPLANNIKDLFQIFTKSVLLLPTCQVFGNRIDELDTPIFIGSDYALTDTSQNSRKPLFALLKFPLHLMPVKCNLDVKVQSPFSERFENITKGFGYLCPLQQALIYISR